MPVYGDGHKRPTKKQTEKKQKEAQVSHRGGGAMVFFVKITAKRNIGGRNGG